MVDAPPYFHRFLFIGHPIHTNDRLITEFRQLGLCLFQLGSHHPEGGGTTAIIYKGSHHKAIYVYHVYHYYGFNGFNGFNMNQSNDW